MAILALIRNPEDISQVISWSAEMALARDLPLFVLCCHPSATAIPEFPERKWTQAVERFLREHHETPSVARLAEAGNLKIEEVGHRDAAACAIDTARREDSEFIVAAAEDPSGKRGATYASNPLLRNAPCNTILLFGGPERRRSPQKIFVATADNPHDGAALFLANQLAESHHGEITLARTEADDEEVNMEVGRRDLLQLMRDTGVETAGHIHCRVFNKRKYREIARAMDDHDLVLMGANAGDVNAVVELTKRPAVAVVKRGPALRPWRQRKVGEDWNPLLSPADYADLLTGLRRGSQLSLDFLIMLGLAAVVASMGLLQDSTAVVIGSMLLAPLMTPMLGCGLALAQANPKLGNTALRAVGTGLALTLAISLLIGFFTPGAELTAEIYARGDPNILDLVVAAASGTAAAYASARPNLVGSIAGVAVATALVPPLCSAGISLAYYDLVNARGAALLFITNFVAIVLFAAVTFRTLGIRTARTGSRQRHWVVGMVAAMAVAGLALLVPLQLSLLKGLLLGKPQPSYYPLSRSVMDALEDYVEDDPNLEIFDAGRPSSPYHTADVVLVLGAPYDLDRQYADALIKIVRREMRNPKLRVEVHLIRELWQVNSR